LKEEQVSIFNRVAFDDHEEIHFLCDPRNGLKAIIAIHSTKLGPALGGCRMYPYASEEAAVDDVLRLSRGMSYKAAIAGVSLGGGKAVIIGDPRRDKTESMLLAFGRAVSRLNGRYIAGEDLGTNPSDMRVIRKESSAVSCLEERDGGYGDPAPLTALGVLQAIRAATLVARQSTDLSGLKVAVQGVGNVGLNLCKILAAEGVELIVCDPDDVNAERAEQLGVTRMPVDAIYTADADVFAPCAIGGVLNDLTIPQLKARIVVGAANNQLAEPRHAEALSARGILYLPDYVANAGGLISCAAEWYRTDRGQVRAGVLAIYESCLKLLRRAVSQNITPSAAADELARQRLDTVEAPELATVARIPPPQVRSR
jgi:leucine dehydrogenase